tara:strand:- start:262 stop:678 length:417 start_codon:yes stop_codon:yes gene_type:complete
MRWILIAAALCLSGCATTTENTLYDQLGQREGIDRIVARFIVSIESRPRVAKHFEKTDLDRFYDKLAEHICFLADGPCEYTGDTMVDVHTGMNISEAEFNLLAEMVLDAMDAEGIPHPVQNDLVARLVPLRSEVIYLP